MLLIVQLSFVHAKDHTFQTAYATTTGPWNGTYIGEILDPDEKSLGKLTMTFQEAIEEHPRNWIGSYQVHLLNIRVQIDGKLKQSYTASLKKDGDNPNHFEFVDTGSDGEIYLVSGDLKGNRVAGTYKTLASTKPMNATFSLRKLELTKSRGEIQQASEVNR